jgi:hypothetical protein
VSVTIETTERQLRFGVLKIGITLAFGLLLAAWILSLVFSFDGGRLSTITINALLIAVAVMILANGCLAILQIVDWFEKRRETRDG